jgi:hypothetical protein
MFECSNCGAHIRGEIKDVGHCSVCGRDFGKGLGEMVRFNDAARDASDGIGGLLEILPVAGRVVKFVGKCVGGVFGVDGAGGLAWRQDWGYITSVDPEGQILRVNGIPVDLDTGAIPKK